jgi:hypothetical protein
VWIEWGAVSGANPQVEIWAAHGRAVANRSDDRDVGAIKHGCEAHGRAFRIIIWSFYGKVI